MKINIPPSLLKLGNGPIVYYIKSMLRKGKQSYLKLSEGKIENFVRVRRGFEKMVRIYNQPEDGFSHIPFEVNGLRCEWVIPEGCDQKKVLLYFHGGGYHFGSIETTRSIVSQLTKLSKTKGLIVEYRKAPEFQYPAPIQDAVQVYNYLLKEQAINPKQIAFGGDSAGGGIASGTLLYLKDNQLPLPKCAVLLCPWVDHTGTSPTLLTKDNVDPMLPAVKMPLYSASYLGNCLPKEAKYACPIFYDLTGLPPLYIQVGEDEILLNDSIALAEKAKQCNVSVTLDVFPNMFHVFQQFHQVIYTAQVANRKLASFIQQQLSEK